MKRLRGGFTLLELLVVILIIGLLVGILLPVLAVARGEAYASVCASNCRQLAIALESYANDFRGLYPYAGGHIDWDALDPADQTRPWMRQVFDYAPVKDFYSGCPTYPEESPYHYFLGTRAAYIHNGNARGSVERKLIRFASAQVLGGDNQLSTLGVDDADKDDYNFQAVFGYSDPATWEGQHRGTVNLIFADTHVARYEDFVAQDMTFRYGTMSGY